MKSLRVAIWTTISIAALMVFAIIFTSYRTRNETSTLQKLVATTRPDISSENGLYGHYRIYTGMLICKDCDSIAARIILKSEHDFSTDGVATFETTKIITGEKPIKLPIQKALWTIIKGNSTDPGARSVSLFTDENSIATFLIDQYVDKAPWKILVEAAANGDPLSSSENRVGKLVLVSEGNTTP